MWVNRFRAHNGEFSPLIDRASQKANGLSLYGFVESLGMLEVGVNLMIEGHEMSRG